MSTADLLQQTQQYYDGRLAEHGPTARGVDWNSEESQRLRFRELTRIMDDDPEASVLDYGCGYGALGPYLRGLGHRGPYVGFDISERMILAARAASADPLASFSADRSRLAPADYTLASGIFNVKQDAGDEEWHRYVIETIGDLADLSRRGFAFNALSRYSDPERRRVDLYYADPLDLFDHCKRRISRFVSLLHDTPLYEFTLIVRLAPNPNPNPNPEPRTPNTNLNVNTNQEPENREG
jgi:SAM-dependent methyltransferase